MKKNHFLHDILSSKNYDVQIIYTKIERKNGKIKFKDYHHNVGGRYFYPSTTVFLPAAVLALEKINRIAATGCDVDTKRNIRIDSDISNKTILYIDSTYENHYANYSEIIKRMLVLNDKNSFNYCYDLLNQKFFNERFHELGYANTWFLHKFNNEQPEKSRHSNSVTFFKTNVPSYFIDLVFQKRQNTTMPFLSVYINNAENNPDDYYSIQKNLPLGKGYIKNDSLVREPMDFKKMNKYSIEDMHNFLKSLIFPDSQTRKLNLKESDYNLIYRYLSMFPSEVRYPKHSREQYPDGFKRYILKDRIGDPSIKIFGNSGKDFGFLIDNAYVIDKQNGIDFLLTVVIKCNRENIFGENYYEYEKIGEPFIREVSKIIYEYEISSRKNFTDFTDFLNGFKDVS
ncbi:MAG: serine hydrolase [Prevotellaceae bacterium]|nr:serine hydrolase [Prevotellaceae bacterium]